MAIIEQYSARITIQSTEGKTVAAGQDMPVKEGKKFIARVRDALKDLAKFPTGRRLLSEVNSAPNGHSVTIFCAGVDSACAQANPNGIQSEVNWMIVPLRPRHKNVPLAYKSYVDKDTGEKKGQERVLKVEMAKQTILGGVVTWAQCGAELNRVLSRVGGGPENDPAAVRKGRLFAGRLLGLSEMEMTQLGRGERHMDDNTYIKICFFFYNHLSPGPGVNSQVRVTPAVRMNSQDGKYKPKVDTDSVPPAIVVGHELIHAWRMMHGRRVVRLGWEEEAMTVGLGLASGWPLTENQLRLEMKLPRRFKYDFMNVDSSVSSSLSKSWMQRTKQEAEGVTPQNRD
jgi:hypothetical protein